MFNDRGSLINDNRGYRGLSRRSGRGQVRSTVYTTCLLCINQGYWRSRELIIYSAEAWMGQSWL